MFYFLELYVILEVYGHEELPNIKLENIPKKIKFTFFEKDYYLIGFINITVFGKQTRSNDIGHYAAICYRNNNKWLKYDDCKDAEQINTIKYKLRCVSTTYFIRTM